MSCPMCIKDNWVGHCPHAGRNISMGIMGININDYEKLKLELSKSQARVDQVMKDWSVDAIKKTEVLVREKKESQLSAPKRIK